MRIEVIPLEQKQPYCVNEHLYEASVKINRKGRTITIYETGTTPEKARRKLISLIKSML